MTWIHGDAMTLPPLQVDVAVMTGNTAQVFLTDDEWVAALRGIRRAFEGSRPSGIRAPSTLSGTRGKTGLLTPALWFETYLASVRSNSVGR